ncbi:uncharacterized protein [Prorops nasuta]|uniref:uncharacterized protein n=1 Tax=Prorops nasuta TaxID=863751 RepID=UPI0034CF5C08
MSSQCSLRDNLSLLPTAQLIIANIAGRQIRARALLDQGSEVSFISESLVQTLQLSREKTHIPISGVGSQKNVIARSYVVFRIKSVIDERSEFDFGALVLKRPANILPSSILPSIYLPLFKELKWADSKFYLPGEVDLILGVDAYALVLQKGFMQIGQLNVIAQNTLLGWVFSGTVGRIGTQVSRTKPKVARVAAYSSENEDLSEIIRKFWSIEEVPSTRNLLTPDEDFCENLFATTHSRDSDGRYVVRLPVKGTIPRVADQTRKIASNSFASLTRKFAGDPDFAREYKRFMQEYEQLGHMKLVTNKDVVSDRIWYLPHHAVVQNRGLKSKLRVVFDASRRTFDQNSLNKFLLAGPALQSELPLILIGWRQHRFVFTADVVKMFRQVKVHESEQNLQRILWSAEQGQPPKDYCLTTVTYGTASAPYLAIRTLLQLAKDEGHRFPLGANCLRHHIYVDDFFTGADNLIETLEIRNQLISILETAGIRLDKWAANTSELLVGVVPTEHLGDSDKSIEPDQAVKTLGLLWDPTTDSFGYQVTQSQYCSLENTKRTILSSIARLFDPLGWLAPMTVRTKILLQDLWILKVDWDSSLAAEIQKRWNDYCGDILRVSDISIPRFLGQFDLANGELHGFADASKRAYAATVYLRTVDANGDCCVNLLIAKTKIAPVKTISIPNLELCAAVLLVKLVKYLRNLDIFKDLPIIAWSDNRDVLCWIRKHPSSWKVFVANRVSFIQTELPSAIWHYVPTQDNPADMATRGVDATKLKESKIWWQGPLWLCKSKQYWPQQPINKRTSDTVCNAFIATTIDTEDPLLTKYSSLLKLLRVTAYCIRFIQNCKQRRNNSPIRTGFLTSREIGQARSRLIHLAQRSAFHDELISLKANQPIPKRSVLYKLKAFLDDQQIIRVGGRLTHSALPFPAKHPPILSKTSNLSQLFVQHAHQMALHGGPTMTLGILLQQIWIISASSLVKRHVRACVRCFRAKPRQSTQLMGSLPSARVTPARPFSIAGLDYAGPFKLRSSKGRGIKATKGYISLFICFATKAIHLEAVSDLTTQSFLAALRRFTSRRGLCQRLYSDNGTNFQGADKELRSLFKTSSDFYSTISADLANQGIDWEFIPPNAPHFGGLWEAGVKATKHHLVRVIGEQVLTYEEFATLLTEIEVCLNSRPLYPFTGDIEDLTALTPSHFLLGHSSSLIPDLPLQDINENRLSRYQLMTRIQQNFWKRWSQEYLHHLQERNKWKGPTINYAVGQMVVVRDDRFPPAKWPLGRVLEIHPGDDGLVRVVTVRTASSIMKRPIVRLSPLPLPEDK